MVRAISPRLTVKRAIKRTTSPRRERVKPGGKGIHRDEWGGDRCNSELGKWCRKSNFQAFRQPCIAMGHAIISDR